MFEIKKRFDRGVTLTELLVVLAIIGLLATIAVPVYVNKMEQAKFNTAKHEVREIANAEEMVGVLYGFYVPLIMLDDLPFRTGNRPQSVDDIQNTRNNVNPLYLISTAIPIIDQWNNQQNATLNDAETVVAINKLYYGWQGPFINFKRYYLGLGNFVEPVSPDSGDVARDYPLDPWGNPYLMLTELGIVGINGDITNDTLNHEFDRMTILSMGPDGNTLFTAGPPTIINPTGEDDIWVHFGGSGLTPETYYGGGPFGSMNTPNSR